jgi:hypothetical protein
LSGGGRLGRGRGRRGAGNKGQQGEGAPGAERARKVRRVRAQGGVCRAAVAAFSLSAAVAAAASNCDAPTRPLCAAPIENDRGAIPPIDWRPSDDIAARVRGARGRGRGGLVLREREQAERRTKTHLLAGRRPGAKEGQRREQHAGRGDGVGWAMHRFTAQLRTRDGN